MEFQPIAGIEISTNVKVKFTSMDGGIERSLTGLTWPFRFVKAVSQDYERPVDTSLKQAGKVEKMLPGLCFVLLQVDTMFTSTWNDSMVGPRPVAVLATTREATRIDNLSSLEEFIETMTVTTMNPKEAATEGQLVKAFTGYASELSKKQAKDLIEGDLVKKITDGRRVYAAAHMKRGEYIRLRPSAEACMNAGIDAMSSTGAKCS